MNNQRQVTHRIVLHRNGDPIHFDVTVDFQRIAEEIGYKAERSVRHVSKDCGGAVKVEYVR